MSEASRVQSPRYSKIRRKGAADGIQLTTACMVCTGWRGSTLATKFLAPARYSTVAPDNTHHRESPFVFEVSDYPPLRADNLQHGEHGGADTTRVRNEMSGRQLTMQHDFNDMKAELFIWEHQHNLQLRIEDCRAMQN
uniref:Uncharacterized protein n=1 Tax=Glossina pallidipes TaxID=7398 RepID=A0A1B0A9Q7_GLOPL